MSVGRSVHPPSFFLSSFPLKQPLSLCLQAYACVVAAELESCQLGTDVGECNAGGASAVLICASFPYGVLFSSCKCVGLGERAARQAVRL